MDHEEPAGLAPLRTTARLVTRWRNQILTFDIRWIAYDPCEAHAALPAATTEAFTLCHRRLY